MRGLRVWSLLLLAGCVGEEVALVESWVGVYQIDTYEVSETCEAPVAPSEPPTPYLVVDARMWEDVTRFRLRRCPTRERCEPGAWWAALTEDVGERRIEGMGLNLTFLPGPELGSCILFWHDLTLTRRGEGELAAQIDLYRVEDAQVTDLEACEAHFESVVDQTPCVERHQLEATRLE